MRDWMRGDQGMTEQADYVVADLAGRDGEAQRELVVTAVTVLRPWLGAATVVTDGATTRLRPCDDAAAAGLPALLTDESRLQAWDVEGREVLRWRWGADANLRLHVDAEQRQAVEAALHDRPDDDRPVLRDCDGWEPAPAAGSDRSDLLLLVLAALNAHQLPDRFRRLAEAFGWGWVGNAVFTALLVWMLCLLPIVVRDWTLYLTRSALRRWRTRGDGPAAWSGG